MKALSGLVIVAAVLAAGVAGFTHGATQTIESPIESPSESESIQMEYGCVGNNHAEPTGLQVTASVTRLDRDGVLDLTLENLDDSAVSVIHEIVIVDPFGHPVTSAQQTEVYAISAKEAGRGKAVSLSAPEADGYYTVAIQTAVSDGKGATQMRTDRIWIKLAAGKVTTVDRVEYETKSGEAEAQSI